MTGTIRHALFASVIAFLAMVGHCHSNGAYCVCKDGASDAQLQKNIDYVCGKGGHCKPILQNGACFKPNTLKDHCHWAVNSYYQRKRKSGATCDFEGTATLSQTSPSQSSSCVYPLSHGKAGNNPDMGTGIGGSPSNNNTFPGTTPGGGFGPTPGVGGYGHGTGTGTGAGRSSATRKFHFSNLLSIFLFLALSILGFMFTIHD